MVSDECNVAISNRLSNKFEQYRMKDLVVYFLVDCSKIMHGARIGCVYSVIEELIEIVNNKALRDPYREVYQIIIKVIAINDHPHIICSSLLENLVLTSLPNEGDFHFGKAIRCVEDDIKQSGLIGQYDPIFILLNASTSKDRWDFALKKNYNNDVFKHGYKLAISIGDHSDKKLLEAFTQNKQSVCSPINIENIKNAFHLSFSYPEWSICGDNFDGCSGDMSLVIDKAIELFGKEIVASPRMLHLLNDFNALSSESEAFILKNILNSRRFESLVNSENWQLDSKAFGFNLSQATAIDITKIQNVLDQIGLGLGHTIYVE